MSLDLFTIIKSMKQSLLITFGLIILVNEKQYGLFINQLKYGLIPLENWSIKMNLTYLIKPKKPSYEVIPFHKCPYIVELYLESIKN